MSGLVKSIRKELASVTQAVEKMEPSSVRKGIAQKPIKKTKASKKRGKKTQRKATAPQPTTGSGKVITGNAIKALRTKLGLSQVEFAKLIGVSGPSITLWERKKGKALQFRKETRPRVEAVMAQPVDTLKASKPTSKPAKKTAKKTGKKMTKKVSKKAAKKTSAKKVTKKA